MAKSTQLFDSWLNNNINSWWTLAGPGVPSNNITAVNNQLQILTDGTANDYYTLVSTIQYDLTNSFVASQLISAGAQAANQDCIPILAGTNGGNSQVWFSVNGNALQAYKRVVGVQTLVATTSYNSSVHKWVRVRESGGTTFWDYSTEGITWTNLGTALNPFTLTSVDIGIQGGQFGAAGTTAYKFTNFNFLPAGNRSLLGVGQR